MIFARSGCNITTTSGRVYTCPQPASWAERERTGEWAEAERERESGARQPQLSCDWSIASIQLSDWSIQLTAGWRQVPGVRP